MTLHRYLVPCVLALVGCGGGGAGGAAGGGGSTSPDAPAAAPGLDPPAPAGGQQLATDTFHLEAGSEHYMCYQFYSPADAVAITHVDSISMAGVHHMALYQSFGTLEADAPHECDDLIKLTWLPIFVSGTGSKDLSLPDGVGFQITGNTQYVLQLHLQNTTDAAIDIRAGVNLTYDHSPSGLMAGGIYGIGNTQISIGAGDTDYSVSEHCAPGKDMNVFAVLGHMHKLGTSLGVMETPGTSGSDSGSDAGSGAGSAAAEPFYSIDPYTFGNQPIVPMTTTIHANDALDVTCHWSNPGSTTVTYGESSDNEMCYFVMFYYPYTGLDGCVD
jgi:hypothetical protein